MTKKNNLKKVDSEPDIRASGAGLPASAAEANAILAGVIIYNILLF